MTRTTTLSVTRDDIIKSALRKLEVIGEGETPSTEDYTNCTFGLNIMLKAWEKDGYYLWKLTEISVVTVASNASYQIGDTATGTGAVVTNRPIRLMDACYIRDSSNNDSPLTIITKQEYNHLSGKTSTGVPNQIYYDQQLTNGVLKMYPTPSDATHTVYLAAQIPVYDFSTDGTETLDFPQEGYQAIVYGLAEEMLDEYPALPLQKEQRIIQKAEFYRSQLADWSQEESSLFLMPRLRNR
jgi:hypothetical protein